MNITYQQTLEFCIQYYVDRGYTVEHAKTYLTAGDKNDIFRVYDIIQEEKKKPVVAQKADLLRNK